MAVHLHRLTIYRDLTRNFFEIGSGSLFLQVILQP